MQHRQRPASNNAARTAATTPDKPSSPATITVVARFQVHPVNGVDPPCSSQIFSLAGPCQFLVDKSPSVYLVFHHKKDLRGLEHTRAHFAHITPQPCGFCESQWRFYGVVRHTGAEVSPHTTQNRRGFQVCVSGTSAFLPSTDPTDATTTTTVKPLRALRNFSLMSRSSFSSPKTFVSRADNSLVSSVAMQSPCCLRKICSWRCQKPGPGL